MSEILPGYAQLNNVLRLTGDNEEMIVTMGVKLEAGVAFGGLDEIAELAFSHWHGAWKALLPNVYTFVRVDMIADIGAGNVVISSAAAAVAGQSTDASLPPNCAYLVKKRSGLGGKPNRGRCYIPGVREPFADNTGMITAANFQQVQDSANAWLTALNGTVGIDQCCILHAPGDFDPPALVTSLVVDPKIATQRRRMR